jgi:hypothetical protein
LLTEARAVNKIVEILPFDEDFVRGIRRELATPKTWVDVAIDIATRDYWLNVEEAEEQDSQMDDGEL